MYLWPYSIRNRKIYAEFLDAKLDLIELDIKIWMVKAGFRPDQPRVPAGNSDGGQWTDEGGSFMVADAETVMTDVMVDNSDGKFDVDSAIDLLNDRTEQLKEKLRRQGIYPYQYGNRQCASYVREAINKGGGLNVQPPSKSTHAKDYGRSLIREKFKVIASDEKISHYPPKGYAPKKGDVAIIQDTTTSPSGHMAMYNGHQWVSDFKQGDFWPGKQYRIESPSYVIYRY